MMNRLPLVLLCALASVCHADIRLPRVLGSHMVLQRETQVNIWGWAEAGETVKVQASWLAKARSAKAGKAGRWEVVLPTGKAGGPHTLNIIGRKTRITLSDILFGEVWIGSGQSNMEMPLIKVSGAYTGIKDFRAEVAAAKHPQIRLFQAGNFSSNKPLDDVQPGITMYGVPKAKCQWARCSPQSIPTFASTAYFFARELHRQLKVPIGIIDASWGGTAAESWTPRAGLQRLGYKEQLQLADRLPQQPAKKIPTRLYNGMIHPLRKLKIRGVVWYQGESNAGRPQQYRQLFTTMIKQWRTAFKQEFSFYYVQISPFRYRLNSAFLREAQLQSMSLQQTGMVVTLDIGNLKDIHPKNKQEVGRRLALWALAKDYGKKLGHSGPLYASSRVQGNQVRIRFHHGEGLATNDKKPPSHLTIAGKDQVFHPAQGKIVGNELVVSSAKVNEPVAVRYAFTSRSIPNLVNQHGLPASSFRTDKWRK